MDEWEGVESSPRWHWRGNNNRPARRFEAVPNRRWSFLGSPVAHDPWRSQCQVAEGRFTLADLVRWMVLPRPMAPTHWRSAPLPAVRCRHMATPSRRIMALSRAGFSRCLSRGPMAPGDADYPRQQAVTQALFFPRSSRLNNRQGFPEHAPTGRFVKPQ